MKKNFTEPSIEIILISEDDIICTSGPVPTKVTDELFGLGNDGVNVGQ